MEPTSTFVFDCPCGKKVVTRSAPGSLGLIRAVVCGQCGRSHRIDHWQVAAALPPAATTAAQFSRWTAPHSPEVFNHAPKGTQ